MLETACKQLATWSERPETARLDLAVNISPRQFGQTNFVDTVIGILENTGADPKKLKIELTENILLSNMDETVSKRGAHEAAGTGAASDHVHACERPISRTNFSNSSAGSGRLYR